MTKTVRIGSGLGFYGDSWEPVIASIQRGGVQYVCSDHLAELTLAILQKDRQREPGLGYARDVVPMLMRLWPLMRERGVKFICNAGGLNPAGAAQALRVAFGTKSWKARIAVVSGDEVLGALQRETQGFAHLFNGAPVESVRERLVFANAYLGAQPIVDALAQGADIVLTGRVADAALFLAPLVHEFGWKLGDAADAADLNKLAQGLAVGHLLECSGRPRFGARRARASAREARRAERSLGPPDAAHARKIGRRRLRPALPLDGLERAGMSGEVESWPLPNILAIKLVLHDALQGGGARNLRMDNLGKAMAGALLRMRVEVSEAEPAACRGPRVGWWPEPAPSP